MKITAITKQHRGRVKQFFESQWGSSEMIISTGTYICDELEGYFYEENQTIIGLVTYIIRGYEIEVISLDSVKEGRGIGSILLETVELLANEKGIRQISLITTNDNLNALKFYQKRGYRIVKIISDGVTRARKLKPTIPIIGDYDIPLHDEILLIKQLSN